MITVAAVRGDARWLGYSSQGEGRPNLDKRKPDLSAPSSFVETDDAHVVNGGTSTACALTAGALAALRQKWANVGPGEMKAVLINTARRTAGPDWNRQIGFGILNLPDAVQEAAEKYP